MENKYTIEIVSQPLYQVDITPTEQFEIDIVAQPQYEVELTGRGPQGVKGDKGDVGPRGPEGPVGPEGPRGPKGDTALTFSVGETTDLQEGEPAYVRNVGTGTDIILDFGIPKGERGNNGASGKGVDIGSIIQSLSKVAPDGFVHTWGESISQEENPELYQACVDGTLPTVNASNGGVTTIYAPNGIFKQTSGTNTLDINTNVVMELAKIGGVVDWNGSYNPQPSGNITLASLSQNVPTQILMFTEGGQNEVHFRFLEGDYSGKLAEAPSNPSNNTLYFNTTDKTYYIYEGGNWNQYGAEGVGYIWLGAIVVTSNPATATWANASFVSTDVTSTGLSEYDQQLVANKGNCGYFGLDTTELSVRVPTMQNVFLEENDTEVGSYKEAGLPNITGQIEGTWSSVKNSAGALYSTTGVGGHSDGYTAGGVVLNLDASRSNTIYGDSDTVQPEAIAVYFYVCVSKYTQLEQGPYFTPHIDSNGILSWTNNGGLINPPNINIKGPKGEDAFTVSIGEVTTLEPDQQATVTNVGTAGNQVWDIAIPRGESGGSGFSLFDTRTLDYELPFEQSEGWALQGTYIYKDSVTGSRYGYPDFYAECVSQKENATATATTLGNNTITMYINGNGHQFYDIADKDVVDNFYNSVGVAWFYGIDTENERVFLPRNDYFDQLTGDVTQVGKFIEAGLPNITGTAGIVTRNNTGALALTPSFSNREYGAGANGGSGLGLDASLSSPVYGKSDTVQPNAVKKLLYICVGNTTVQSSVTNITEITTSENDTLPLFYNFYSQEDMTTTGAYVNASLGSWLSGNVYATAYNELVNKLGTGNVKANTDTYTDYDFVVNQDDMTFRLPLLNGEESIVSDRYIDLQFSGDGTYAPAPANGWYYLSKFSSASGQWVVLENTANSISSGFNVNGSGQLPKVFVEVAKGDVINVSCSLGGNTDTFRFIYAKGDGNLYYKVANAVENIEVLDVAKVTADLNTCYKRNTGDNSDLSGLAMPSNKYIDLTLGASGTQYTAPANGWFNISGVGSSTTQGYVFMFCNATSIRMEAPCSSGLGVNLSLPVKKGDIMTMTYALFKTGAVLRFTYAEGEV